MKIEQMTTDDKASTHTASSTTTFSNSANTTQLLLQKIDGFAVSYLPTSQFGKFFGRIIK